MFGFSEQLMLSENDFLYFEEVSRCWMQDTKDGAALIRCLFRSRSHLSMTNICFFQHVSLQVILFGIISQCPTISPTKATRTKPLGTSSFQRLELPLGEMDAVYCLEHCNKWSCNSMQKRCIQSKARKSSKLSQVEKK